MAQSDLLELTAEIVAAHVSNNRVAPEEVPVLIQGVYSALEMSTHPAMSQPVRQDPAVPIRSSVKPDYLVCLEDGAKVKTLKRRTT